MVFILFVQVLKSLKSELKNPAATLFFVWTDLEKFGITYLAHQVNGCRQNEFKKLIKT